MLSYHFGLIIGGRAPDNFHVQDFECFRAFEAPLIPQKLHSECISILMEEVRGVYALTHTYHWSAQHHAHVTF